MVIPVIFESNLNFVNSRKDKEDAFVLVREDLKASLLYLKSPEESDEVFLDTFVKTHFFKFFENKSP